MKTYFVYILTNRTHTVLYISVTNNIARRILEHKKHKVKGFTDKYNCTKLVYLEQTNYVQDAIQREKQLKNWHRQWKIEMIEEINPQWEDLAISTNLLGDIEI